MVPQLSPSHSFLSHELSADSDHQVLLFPTPSATNAQSDVPAQPSGHLAHTPRARISTRALRGIVILGVAGRISEVVEDLDRAIQLALADRPLGVVCDLSAVLEPHGAAALEILATAGRHPRDWPGLTVGVVCPDPRVREGLRVHPLGRHLMVAESLFAATSAVLATPALAVESLRLAAHPTAPRASRNFVSRTLLDWQLSRVIPFASLVVSELVANSSINAGTDIDVSITWNLGALRLTVRDDGPALPGQPGSGLDLHGRGRTVVAGLSRAFGVLPNSNGGKVVWAVLDAPRRPPASIREHSANPTRLAAGAGAGAGAGAPAGTLTR